MAVLCLVSVQGDHPVPDCEVINEQVLTFDYSITRDRYEIVIESVLKTVPKEIRPPGF